MSSGLAAAQHWLPCRLLARRLVLDGAESCPSWLEDHWRQRLQGRRRRLPLQALGAAAVGAVGAGPAQGRARCSMQPAGIRGCASFKTRLPMHTASRVLSAQCAGAASFCQNRFASRHGRHALTCPLRLSVCSAGVARRPPGGSDWRAGGALGQPTCTWWELGGGCTGAAALPPPPFPTPTMALPTSPASLPVPLPPAQTYPGSSHPTVCFPNPTATPLHRARHGQGAGGWAEWLWQWRHRTAHGRTLGGRD